MSNLIPPLLSSSPPPIIGPLEEDDDDEFGDFRAAADSYDCDDLSLPSSPQKSPEKEIKSDLPKVNLDINSNSQKNPNTVDMPTECINESTNKDFQDRRKSIDESINSKLHENQVNCSHSHLITPASVCNVDNETKEASEVLSECHVANGLEEGLIKTNFIDSSDQNNVFSNDSNLKDDDFADLQCGVISVSNNEVTIENVETGTNKIEIDDEDQNDLSSFSNGENLFEDLSESVHMEKANSDDLSELNETNEIKSENDCLDEINSELVNEDDKNDNSLKESNCESSEVSLSLKVGETDPKVSDDEFGNFEDHFNDENQKIEDEENRLSLDNEFDDFVSPLPPPQSNIDVDQDDDDFGEFASSDLTKEDLDEFADFSAHSSSEKPVLMEVDIKNAVAKSEVILKDVFHVIEKKVDDFENVDETKGNTVFEELKDITETNALLYQWSKSSSQKMFLKALNIDMRNILYGPAWNASMPRFAANLGLTPLEPVKSEILTPTPVQQVSSPSNSSQKNQSDIPTAQFDWSGSGLINPLDSASTDPPGNVPEDSSQSQVKTDFLPNSERSEPLSSLFEPEIVQKPVNTEQMSDIANNFDLPKVSNEASDDDFTQFQSPKVMIPLRETHISTEIINDFGGNKPGWLEPTILTPDLPRKEPVIDPDDDDDEFDDFQMVLPENPKEQPHTTIESINKDYLPDIKGADPVNKTTVDNREHILALDPLTSLKENLKNNNDDEDDEFTDFHSHSTLPQSSIFTPLQPVPAEPLKPSVQYSTPISTQINWPEPGVTDEDIKNIELTYSRKSNEDKNAKSKTGDEDEWSDFVSVTTATAVKITVPERTSTPDLPLSVLNLNHVQPPKQPIPVITPAGLIQTKLSSTVPKSSNVVQTALQPNLFKPQQSQFQPSIISNQFSANLFSNSCNGTTSANQSQNNDDDDDWSEFVSSQPIANGCQQRAVPSQTKVAAPQANWTNATTNIIMNPSHFDSFSSYVPHQNKKVAKNTIPTISTIPDLEFIAPKNRTKK